ncbi:Hsp70 family protein [Rhodococcus sp. HNM0563]|uniref:Hsp70 family protein n=1 Tax=unclassified Rhodococcus (in: high G+C Gram-positive bacteria) TaxID=192944 RepID=UPI001469AC63|nr:MULTISPECIES: Hsp70 family protein [unclassified Rhodococcus (in: high G+C Gram-positive bacteria)]MCK0090435.1 Hsp70 family protein [Rhodococcus sp. F64268]NLU61642.1 Hsp70 family protein [Rhodococcus sp. HNM0563]
MSSVLGVTVGESAVRIVRPIDRTAPSAGFQFQVVEAGKDEPTRLAARTLGVLSQTGIAGEPIDALGIVYRDEAQAERIRAALAVEHLSNFTLVSEPEAALAYLQATGELGSDTAVFYDLGDSGLTVTIVDLGLREVLAERTDTIGGRIFDQVIREHQLDTNGVWRPDDPATDDELSAQCREAKEKLSATDSVAVPGAAGVVLMSRDTFDPLIAQCVESSAQFVHHVIARSGRNPDAVVLLGGGAHIPLVQEVLRSWIGLPLVVPHEPELVLAKGGAILAGKPSAPQSVSSLTRIVPPAADMSAVTEQIPVVTAPVQPSAQPEPAATVKKSWIGALSHRGPEVSGKQISGAGLAGTALAVVAVIGVSLGAGNGLFSGSSDDDGASPTETFVTPTTSRSVPRPQPAVAPATVTTTPPVTTTVTQSEHRPVPPSPEPSPPPPPQLIPGVQLPVIELPTIELPPLPQIQLPGL